MDSYLIYTTWGISDRRKNASLIELRLADYLDCIFWLCKGQQRHNMRVYRDEFCLLLPGSYKIKQFVRLPMTSECIVRRLSMQKQASPILPQVKSKAIAKYVLIFYGNL